MPILGLGLLVSFVQARVFALLTMLYLSGSVEKPISGGRSPLTMTPGSKFLPYGGNLWEVKSDTIPARIIILKKGDKQ